MANCLSLCSWIGLSGRWTQKPTLSTQFSQLRHRGDAQALHGGFAEEKCRSDDAGGWTPAERRIHWQTPAIGRLLHRAALPAEKHISAGRRSPIPRICPIWRQIGTYPTEEPAILNKRGACSSLRLNQPGRPRMETASDCWCWTTWAHRAPTSGPQAPVYSTRRKPQEAALTGRAALLLRCRGSTSCCRQPELPEVKGTPAETHYSDGIRRVVDARAPRCEFPKTGVPVGQHLDGVRAPRQSTCCC